MLEPLIPNVGVDVVGLLQAMAFQMGGQFGVIFGLYLAFWVVVKAMARAKVIGVLRDRAAKSGIAYDALSPAQRERFSANIVEYDGLRRARVRRNSGRRRNRF